MLLNLFYIISILVSICYLLYTVINSCFSQVYDVPPWILSRVSLPRFTGVHSRRLWGRGRAFVGVSTAHDMPAGELIIHLAWDHLPDSSRATLCDASVAVAAYARLWYYACRQPRASWKSLCDMGTVATAPQSISPTRAYRLAALLLLFDFDLDDLIR